MTATADQSNPAGGKPEKKNDAVRIVFIIFGFLAVIMVLPCIVALVMSWLWIGTQREEIAARNLEADMVRLEQQLQVERKASERARLEAERVKQEAREAVLRQKGQTAPIASPDRRRSVLTTVNTDKADPGTYLCLRLRVLAADGKRLQEIQTSASVLMTWALGWHGNDTIVLYSSDIGTSAWQANEQGKWEPLPFPLPEEIVNRGKELRMEKYGTSSPKENR